MAAAPRRMTIVLSKAQLLSTAIIHIDGRLTPGRDRKWPWHAGPFCSQGKSTRRQQIVTVVKVCIEFFSQVYWTMECQSVKNQWMKWVKTSYVAMQRENETWGKRKGTIEVFYILSLRPKAGKRLVAQVNKLLEWLDSQAALPLNTRSSYRMVSIFLRLFFLCLLYGWFSGRIVLHLPFEPYP